MNNFPSVLRYFLQGQLFQSVRTAMQEFLKKWTCLDMYSTRSGPHPSTQKWVTAHKITDHFKSTLALNSITVCQIHTDCFLKHRSSSSAPLRLKTLLFFFFFWLKRTSSQLSGLTRLRPSGRFAMHIWNLNAKQTRRAPGCSGTWGYASPRVLTVG